MSDLTSLPLMGAETPVIQAPTPVRGPEGGFFRNVAENVLNSWWVQQGQNIFDTNVPADPSFNPVDRELIRGKEEYIPYLREARSREHFDAIYSRIQEYEERRKRLAEEGGIGSSLVSGIFDPANFIGLGVVARAGALRGALMGGASTAAVGAGTAVLEQAVAPMESSEIYSRAAIGAAFGSIFGGIVGRTGIPSNARMTEFADELSRQGRNIDEGVNVGAFGGNPLDPASPYTPFVARETGSGPTGIAPAYGLENISNSIGDFGPLVSSKHRSFEDFALSMAGTGQLMNRNLAGEASPQSALLRSQKWVGFYTRYAKEIDDIYVRYISGGQEPASVLGVNLPAAGMRVAQAVGVKPRDGKMTEREFYRAVARAHFRDKIDDPNPFVKEAALAVRPFYDEMRDYAIEANMIMTPQTLNRSLGRVQVFIDKNQARRSELETKGGITPEGEVDLKKLTANERVELQILTKALGRANERADYYRGALSFIEGKQKPGPRAATAIPEREPIRTPSPANENVPAVNGVDVSYGPTGKNKPDGSPVIALYRPEENKIYFDREASDAAWQAKAWRNPKMEGVTPLPDELFPTPDDWANFIMRHELSHVTVRRGAGLTGADYENLINDIARRQLEELQQPTQVTTGVFQGSTKTSAVPKGLKKTAGWKFHIGYNSLSVDKGIFIEKLKSLGLRFKEGINSGQTGKDFTIYIGSRELADKAAMELSLLTKGKIYGDALGDDIQFAPGIGARFDADGDVDFHQYGKNGIPILKDLIQFGEKDKFTDAAIAQSEKVLSNRYGEFYSGKKGIQAAANENYEPFLGPANEKFYLNRIWNLEKIMEDEAGPKSLRKILTQWYTSNPRPGDKLDPASIDARVNETVANIMKKSQLGELSLGNKTDQPFLSRDLDIPNELVWDFIEDDIQGLMRSYADRVGKSMEVARIFGERDAQEAIYDAAIIAAREMKGSEATISKRIEKLIGHAENLRDFTLGDVYSHNPMSLNRKAVSIASNFSTITSLGGALLSSLTEPAKAILMHGFGRTFRFAFDGLTDPKAFGQMSKDMRELTGQAVDTALGSHLSRYAEQGGPLNGSIDWAGRMLDKVNRPLSKFTNSVYFNMNLLGPYTDALKSFSNVMNAHYLIDDAKAIVAGTANSRVKANFRAAGLSPEDAARIADMPYERDRALNLTNIGAWTDSELVRKFGAAVATQTMRQVVTATEGDIPNIARGFIGRGENRREIPYLRLPFQFMNFAFASTNKTLVSALQGREANVVGGFMTMLGLAYLSLYFKTPEKIWDKMPFEDRMIRTVEQSGLLGIFSDVSQKIEGITRNQFGLRAAFDLPPRYGPRSVDELAPIGEAFGPVAGKATDIYQLMFDDSMTRREEVRGIRRLLPLNDLFYIKGIVGQLEKGALEASY
jgi:hypothetical protein